VRRVNKEGRVRIMECSVQGKESCVKKEGGKSEEDEGRFDNEEKMV
jgi:hypothetical protein